MQDTWAPLLLDLLIRWELKRVFQGLSTLFLKEVSLWAGDLRSKEPMEVEQALELGDG